MSPPAPDLSREEMIARAQQAVEDLAADYMSQVAGDVSTLRTLADRHQAGSGDVAPIQEEVFAIAHNIKGQAGSFGYTLLTDISASLCEICRETPEGQGSFDRALEPHVKAMETVVTRDVKGDGGASGEKLLAHLRSLA